METNKLGTPQQRTKPKIVINTVAVTLVLALLSTVGILLAYHIKNGLDMSRLRNNNSQQYASDINSIENYPIDDNQPNQIQQDSNVPQIQNFVDNHQEINVTNFNNEFVTSSHSIYNASTHDGIVPSHIQNTNVTSRIQITNKQTIINTTEQQIEYIYDKIIDMGSYNVAPEISNDDNVDENSIRAKVAYVQGTLYLGGVQGGGMPTLKQAKVELYDADILYLESKLGTTYTDDNGFFSFTFNNDDGLFAKGRDIFLRIYPETQSLKVGPLDGGLRHYVAQTQIFQDVADESTTIMNYLIGSSGNDAAKSFHVAQGMAVTHRFATQMGGIPNGKLRVVYPSPFGSTSFAYGNLTVKEIINLVEGFLWYLLPSGAGLILSVVIASLDINGYNGFSCIAPNDWNDWDTFGHEYGHFVEGMMGNYAISVADLIKYREKFTHYGYTDHFFDKVDQSTGADKDFAMILTWTEAWATAFAQIAQEYYKAEYKNMYDFADGIAGGVHYETFQPSEDSGEAQENAVTAFLWDLFDSGSENGSISNEVEDDINLGFYSWWSATTKKDIYTLTDFANYSDIAYSTHRSSIGEIMGKAQIAPNNIGLKYIDNATVQGQIEISWKVNGSTNNPNDRFKILFYDQYNSLRYTTDYIHSDKIYTDIFYYRLPDNEWSTILSMFGNDNNIIVSIAGYHAKFFPESGAYQSVQKLYNISNSAKKLNIASNIRYTEDIIFIQQGQFVDYVITFESAGLQTIQTFGNNDTYLQVFDINGTPMATNDNSGYMSNALISYAFLRNMEYRVRVNFVQYIQGNTKLAITPVFYQKEFDEIEGLWQGSMGFNGMLEQGTVDFRTLKGYTDNPITIQTHNVFTQMDTFLYVIDPTSTSLISTNPNEPSVYNDDGDDFNAKITKIFNQNITYLIIISAYDILATSGIYTLTVR